MESVTIGVYVDAIFAAIVVAVVEVQGIGCHIDSETDLTIVLLAIGVGFKVGLAATPPGLCKGLNDAPLVLGLDQSPYEPGEEGCEGYEEEGSH